LPLDQAIRNYARYRQEPESWMLGRFICPAARLAELAPFCEELFLSGPPVPFSVLGRGGDTVGDFQNGLASDVGDVVTFLERQGKRVAVEGLETRLPKEILRKQGEARMPEELFRKILGLILKSELSTPLQPEEPHVLSWNEVDLLGAWVIATAVMLEGQIPAPLTPFFEASLG